MSAVSAAPCLKCVVSRLVGGRSSQSAGKVVAVGLQQPGAVQVVQKTGHGTETTADVAGKIISTGNARGLIAGGARASELLADQKAGADARVKLTTQRDGLGAGSAAAVGRSDVAAGLELAASSQGDARTETSSTGEASTEADAVGKAATLAEGAKTDADGGSSSATVSDGTAAGVTQSVGTAGRQPGLGTDAGSGAASQVESTGSGGSRAAGRGRGAAVDSDTASRSGSQTKVAVIGDGKAEAVESGGASGQLGSDGIVRVGRTKARSKGDVKTRGKGAKGEGETSAKGVAGQNGTTSSDSSAANQLKASRDGAAKADIITESSSALGLDAFSRDLVVNTKSKTSGSQTTAGSASAAANGGSTAGSTLISAGSVADSVFKAKTSGAGHIKGLLESRGQGRVTDGKPVVQVHKPDVAAEPDVIVKQPATVAQPGPYVPPVPYVPPGQSQAPYVPPVRAPAPYGPPYVPPQPTRAPYIPPYVPPQPTQAPYVPPHVPPYRPPHTHYRPPLHKPSPYQKTPY